MSSVKILIVEDESIVAMDIKHRLEIMNYEVADIVSSGEEAVKKANEIIPHLILMDIVLRGDMDGIDAAHLIRNRNDIPIVYLTAYSDENTLKRAKITGPFGYIIKPFDDRELHSAIEVALYKHKMESKLIESEKRLYTTLESIDEAVITTDEKGYINFINPVAQKLTGWKQGNAMGKLLKDVLKIINEETGDFIDLSIDNLIQKNFITECKYNLSLITKSGAKVPINGTNAPIIDNNKLKIGIVLAFQDITKRRNAEKERELLLQEKARKELFGFLLSAIPVFASNIPPQIRNNMARSFGDRLERNMKSKFEESIYKCISTKESPDDEDRFKCYLNWIEGFLFNLGIKVEKLSRNRSLIFSNCPLENEAGESPMFCLICRIIVLRSFTWISIKGDVEQASCMADGNKRCVFNFTLSK